MAITFRTVYLETNDAWKKRKKNRKKSTKRQRVLLNDDDIQREEEQKELEEQLHGEMEMAGLAGMFPLSFGSTKKKHVKTALHVKFDENGNQTEVQTKPIVLKRAREDDEFEDNAEFGDEGAPKDVILPSGKPSDLDASLEKYWAQRYTLFTKYDHGIRLDHEGWFSVTPEIISKHHAKRIACDIVIDAFTGCGGNAIQLAFTCRQVIAIDMDPDKIEIAKHNAHVYGVADRIEWVVGDAFQLLPTMKADVIFLSPPWGGPEYLNASEFHLDTMTMGNHNGIDLFHLARTITSDIVYFLPRNTSKAQVRLLAPQETCEFEHNYLNKKLKTVTIYFGALACALDRTNSTPNPNTQGHEETIEASIEKDTQKQSPLQCTSP